VTGGGSGIGQAACRLFAEEGARVVVSDVDERVGNETVQSIQAKNGDARFWWRSDSEYGIHSGAGSV
jgi:NAD(P)-dependent dehydrogenase (short-subunit alcohol dehydrogenase family)